MLLHCCSDAGAVPEMLLHCCGDAWAVPEMFNIVMAQEFCDCRIIIQSTSLGVST
jgi:hypothetical protein